MFEWLHLKWLKRKLFEHRGGYDRGEYEVMDIVYNAIRDKYHEDNEATSMTHLFEVAIVAAINNSKYHSKEQILNLVVSKRAVIVMGATGDKLPETRCWLSSATEEEKRDEFNRLSRAHEN